MKRLYTVALLASSLTACAESDPAGPSSGPVDVGVMARNIYLGTGLDPILQVADLAELPAAVAETWASVQATDFPGDFFLGNLRPATDTALDYLALLLDSLTVRGASYTVAARTVGFDAEAPLETASGLDDLRVTDSEVILVRSDVGVGAVAGATFERNLVVALGDVSVTIRRGWAAVEVAVGGLPFRFVSTHLEHDRDLFDHLVGRIPGCLGRSPSGSPRADLLSAGRPSQRELGVGPAYRSHLSSWTDRAAERPTSRCRPGVAHRVRPLALRSCGRERPATDSLRSRPSVEHEAGSGRFPR